MKEEANNQQLILDELKNASLPARDAQRYRHLDVRDNLSTVLDTQNYFYFIVDGKLKLSQINFETSKEQTLYLLTRGDMLDIITLLDGKEHELFGEVLEATDLIEVPIDNVRYLLDKDPAFKELFFPYLAKQLRSMEDLAIDLSLYDVYERLVHMLLKFSRKEHDKETLEIIDNLSHEELASMVGSVRKVVNRNLQRLKKEGIIDISRKQLKLESLQKLRDTLQDTP